MPNTVEIRERLASICEKPVPPSSDETAFAGPQPDCPRSPTADFGTTIEADSMLTPVKSPGLFQLIELILKDRPQLERIIHAPSLSAELIPRFLAIALIAFTLFGTTLAIVISAVGMRIHLNPIVAVLEGHAPTLIEFTRDQAIRGRGLAAEMFDAAKLISAYDLGLIAAAGVCLPSLFFYGLLAGVPMSMARVTVHTLKGMATTAVALVGILPIYMAFTLGAAVFQMADMIVNAVLWLGLILPFIAGLFGVGSLYSGFSLLAQSLPAASRCQRSCLLRRLIVSWSVCYTAVTPVMIFTLWEYFSRGL
jgi:hypothetical protein